MTDRPDYVTCIAHTRAQREAWCDRRIGASEFAFESIDHAAYNARGKGRLEVCPGCAAAVVALLEGHAWKSDPSSPGAEVKQGGPWYRGATEADHEVLQAAMDGERVDLDTFMPAFTRAVRIAKDEPLPWEINRPTPDGDAKHCREMAVRDSTTGGGQARSARRKR